MSKVLSFLLVAIAAFGLACGDDEAGGSAGGKGARKKAAAKKTAQDSVVEPVAYHYDPTDKTDPFRSYIKTLIRIDDDISSPLQRFELSQLSITGIVWLLDEPRALIQDPTGKGYIVPIGAPIGKNKGRVVTIDDNRVRVKETYVDHLNRATSKEVDLYMYQRSTEG